ncbi:hypothetical protein ASC75_08090 [Aminobacter sp. DSM 101952]|nr:hypothetical protein CO731_03169 [Aminobacter sp. MSH1]KQU70074.1 hypothetical protein ASC75_08090 [Aminobacter sp. DSM 101952]
MNRQRLPTEVKISLIVCMIVMGMAALSLAGLDWFGQGGGLAVVLAISWSVVLHGFFCYWRFGIGFFETTLLSAVDPNFRRAVRRQPPLPEISQHQTRSKKKP